MHSYKSLAVLALAVSTASTAFSAPVQESQQQARSVIGAPLNVGRDELSKRLDVSALLDQLRHHPPFSPGARDTVDLDRRLSLGGIGSFLSGLAKNKWVQAIGLGAAGGAASTGAGDLTNTVLNSTRRAFPGEPPHSCLGLSPVETAVCIEKQPIERDDLSARDVIEALQILKRQLIEELD